MSKQVKPMWAVVRTRMAIESAVNAMFVRDYCVGLVCLLDFLRAISTTVKEFG